MNNPQGAKVWLFADGDLPEPKKDGDLYPHEALMVLNTSDKDATITLDFYFSDREPISGIKVKVPARRVVNFRMDKPETIGGVKLPYRTQYALRATSNVEVVMQFGRLDTAQPNMSFYTVTPFTI
ncbi:MAG: sensory rhodopsin transducer [Actinobacteria bacterium]|nr:sensory rhodopsin transducer [Actinomycetota bacterium]MCL5986998.1 sensory rhodopsin transducer [Actinomycetota bacterium]